MTGVQKTQGRSANGMRGPASSRPVARFAALLCLLFLAIGTAPAALAQSPAEPAAPAVAPRPQAPAEIEALVETTKGEIVLRFFPNEAPKHVAYFVEAARAGKFDGTTFHRAMAYAIVQGGDPLSKDPKKKASYGTGGLKLLPDEINALPHYPGAVSAVAIPGPGGAPVANSSGAQFFICDTWQKQLDGKYTVFGRVSRGMDVVRAISVAPVQGDKIVERVEIKRVTIRPATPAPEELATLRARVVTPAGEIVFELLADTAPENARHWLDLARSGYYDGASIYRAIPGFVVQGADVTAWPAESPNRKRSFSVWPVKAELSPSVVMDRGLVGLAHGDDPNDGSVHFFFLLGRAAQLDGKFTAFGRVVSGLDVLDKISTMPVTGDKLNAPVAITRIVVEGLAPKQP